MHIPTRSALVTGEEKETQRGQVTCPSHTAWEGQNQAEAQFPSKSLGLVGAGRLREAGLHPDERCGHLHWGNLSRGPWEWRGTRSWGRWVKTESWVVTRPKML